MLEGFLILIQIFSLFFLFQSLFSLPCFLTTRSFSFNAYPFPSFLLLLSLPFPFFFLYLRIFLWICNNFLYMKFFHFISFPSFFLYGFLPSFSVSYICYFYFAYLRFSPHFPRCLSIPSPFWFLCLSFPPLFSPCLLSSFLSSLFFPHFPASIYGYSHRFSHIYHFLIGSGQLFVGG